MSIGAELPTGYGTQLAAWCSQCSQDVMMRRLASIFNRIRRNQQLVVAYDN